MSVQNALMSQAHNTNTKTNMTASCTASVYLCVNLETNVLHYAKKMVSCSRHDAGPNYLVGLRISKCNWECGSEAKTKKKLIRRKPLIVCARKHGNEKIRRHTKYVREAFAPPDIFHFPTIAYSKSNLPPKELATIDFYSMPTIRNNYFFWTGLSHDIVSIDTDIL